MDGNPGNLRLTTQWLKRHDTAPAWWGAAAFAFMVAGLSGLVVVQMKTPCSGAAARRVVGVR